MRNPKVAVLARLRMLAGLELANIALFGWFVFVVRDAPAGTANLAGFTEINVLDRRRDLATKAHS